MFNKSSNSKDGYDAICRDCDIKQHDEYYSKNREEVIRSTAEWAKNNRDKRRIISKTSAARRRFQATEGMTDEDKIISLEYRKAIFNDLCFYCGEPGEHDDHFFPLAKGGTDHWWNLVRACATCNTRKHTHCGTWFILNVGIQ